MRYFKISENDGSVVTICKGYGSTVFNGIEITEAEYTALLAEIRQKAELVQQVYTGDTTIEAVPAEWREEIQRRVDERRAWDAETKTDEISAEEALAIITGGAV